MSDAAGDTGTSLGDVPQAEMTATTIKHIDLGIIGVKSLLMWPARGGLTILRSRREELTLRLRRRQSTAVVIPGRARSQAPLTASAFVSRQQGDAQLSRLT